MRRGHQHSSVLQFFSTVSQHVLGQNHAGRPELATAAIGEVLAQLDRLGQETAKVESRVAGSLVDGEGGQILVERQGREFGRW